MQIMTYRQAVFFIFTALLAANDVSSSRADIQSESERAIRKQFGSGRLGTGLQLSQQGETTSLELCFDRCDVFRWRGSPHAPEIWDFVLAYEHKRGVGSIDDPFIAATQKIANAAAKRMRSHCKASSDQSDLDCDWAALAKSKGIRVGLSNYDEGQRCFVWVNLSSNSIPDKWSCAPIKRHPRKK